MSVIANALLPERLFKANKCSDLGGIAPISIEIIQS